MDLEVRDLRLVVAVVDEGSLTSAAEQLHLTQSALTHHLRKLERRIGQKLFDRARGMHPTPLGSRLIRHARSLLSDIRAAEEDLERVVAGEQGELRIGAQCYTAFHWLTPVIRQFGHSFPGVAVRLLPEITEQPHRAVTEAQADLAFVADERADGRLTSRRLFEDEFIAVSAVDHRWAGLGRPLRASDFDGEHLLVFRTRAVSDPASLPLPRGVKAGRISAGPMSTEAVIDLVRAHQGITVMAKWAARPFLERDPELVGHRIGRRGIWQAWHAITRADESSTATRAFLRMVTAARSHVPGVRIPKP